ncbi:MAG TPA: hypothetical protein VGE47_01215 [Burkholderiaceae bacterium]
MTETNLIALFWSDADQVSAAAEGWNLFEVPNAAAPDGKQWDIQREDDGKAFGKDEEAVFHVYTQAMQGSDLHRRALKIALSTSVGHTIPRVGLNLTGGVVQGHWGSEPIDVSIVDYDVEDDKDNGYMIDQGDGVMQAAYVGRFTVCTNPDGFQCLDEAEDISEDDQEAGE